MRRGVLACVAMLLLAACGGASNSTSSNGLMQAKIGKAVDTIGFSTVDIAIHQGFFKKQGVQVTETLMGGSSQANAALQGGSLQFTTASSSALLLARQKSVPLLSVASLDYGVPLQLVVANQWLKDHGLSTSQPIADRIRGLKGSKLAAISATDKAFMQLLLKEASLSAGSISEVSVQGGSQAATTLAHGQADELLTSPPSSLAVVQQGHGSVLLNFKEVPQFRDMAYDLLLTTQDQAKSNPKLVTAVATAMAQADDFMREHPEQALAVEHSHFPNYQESVLKDSLTIATFAQHGQQTATQWSNAADVFEKTGQVKGNVTAKEGTDWSNKYIDTSRLNA